MLKRINIVFFLLLGIFFIYSQDQKENSFFFGLMTEKEVDDYFSKFQYLIAIDQNKVKITDEQIENFFTNFIGKDRPESLMLESFFRQTKNRAVQQKVLNYIKKTKLDDEFSKVLIRKYNSKEKKVKQNDFEQIQYSYNNELFDENINLFYQTERLLFNKELGLMLFDNPWLIMKFNDKKETVNKNEDAFFLFYGGGTNSMTINFKKYENISFEDFKSKEIEKEYNYIKYKGWKTVELEKKGIFEKSGADKIFIGYGVGPDIIPEIDSGTFSVYLYNDTIKKGYSVTYFMNFSKINNNYKLRYRIWNQLLYQLCFTFINVS